MDFNLWPYSNCKDRQLYPPSTQTTTLSLQDYFTGVIKDSTIQQYPPSSSINFAIDNITGNISFQISPSQNVYGLQYRQNFQFAIGRDSYNASWQQSLIILDSCKPEDLIWQVMQDKRTIPLSLGILYGQRFNLTLPKIVISTKTLQGINIDTNYYPELFKYQLYYQKGASYAQFESAVMNISKGIAYFYFPIGAKDKNYFLTGYVSTLMPYSYINSTTLQVFQSYINATTVVQPLIDLQVINNLAPQFKTPLQDQIAFAGQTLIYSLPDLVDPDSDFAQFFTFFALPKIIFAQLIRSGNQYGNQIVFRPEKQDIGTYTVYLRIQDDGLVKAITINLFQLVVKEDQSNDQLNFVTPSSIKEYTSISNYQMNITKITSEADVYFLFNRQTSLYINQNIAKNVTIIDYLPSILVVSHFQTDRQTKSTKQLANPNFRVKSFNGNTLVIVLSFPDQEQLSQSLLVKVDSVQFFFNNTSAFVTQDGYNRPQKTDFTLYRELPIFSFGNQSRITQVILESVNTTSNSFTGILTANFVLNIIMSTSLQALWSTLNIMQLMLHTPLLNIVLPTTSYVLCNSLIQVTSFQIIDTDKMTSYIFDQNSFSNQSLAPMSDRYNLAGYPQQNIIYNLGLIFYLFLFVTALATLSGILKLVEYIVPNYFYLTQKIPLFIDSQVKFSWFVRYFIEGNFVFLVCAQMQINVFNSISSWVDQFSNALAISLLLLSLIVPILCYVKIRKIFISESLDDQNQLETFGELYEAQLHENPKLSHLVYNIALMVRRIVVSVCLSYMDKTPAFQIGFQLMMCVYWTGYVITERPFEDPSLNWLDFFNNICYYFVLLVCYCLTSFNNQTSHSFEYLGWAFNGLILGMLLSNMGYMLVGLCHNLNLRLKRLYIKIKYGKSQPKVTNEDGQLTRETQVSQSDQIIQQSESDVNNLVNAKLKNLSLISRIFKEDKPNFAKKYFSGLKHYKKNVKIQRSQPKLPKQTNLKKNESVVVQQLVWDEPTRNDSMKIQIEDQSIQLEEYERPQINSRKQPSFQMQVAQPPVGPPPSLSELIYDQQEYIRRANEANSELKRNFYIKRANEIAQKISPTPPAPIKEKIPIIGQSWAQKFDKSKATPYEYPFSFQRPAQQNVQQPTQSYQEPIQARVQYPNNQSMMLQDFDLDYELELVRKAGW